MKNKNPKDGELWLVKLSEHINSVVTICDDQFLHGEFYKSHSCTDVSDENLIERLYTQRQADAYAKKCVDHDRKRFASEKCVQCGYSLKQAEKLEQQMNDKQETVLATEMSERDIPDFDSSILQGVFDACANNEVDFDNAPQQVESLRATTKEDYDKGMRDCVKAIASQIGLTFGVDVGYADLPYKLATYIADLKVDGAVDAASSEWDGKGIPPFGVECEILDAGGESILGVGEIYFVDGSKVFILSKGIKDYPEESVIVGFDGDINLYVMWVNDDYNRFRKIESPQEKADREREENGKALFELKVSLVPIPCFDWEDQAESSRESWRQLAELVTLKD